MKRNTQTMSSSYPPLARANTVVVDEQQAIGDYTERSIRHCVSDLGSYPLSQVSSSIEKPVNKKRKRSILLEKMMKPFTKMKRSSLVAVASPVSLGSSHEERGTPQQA